MASFEHRLPADAAEGTVLDLVARLNADEAVDGILVQLPLPPQIDSARVLLAIDPSKDVDGFHPVNAGRLATGQPALVPCTPLGCVILAKSVVPEAGEGKTRLAGDVAFAEASAVAGAITPVPGGVGPMTIACLLRNTLQAARARRGLPVPDLSP